MLNFILFFVSLPNALAFKETLHGRRVLMDTSWIFIEKADLEGKKVFYHQRECYKCLWSELKFDLSDENGTDFTAPMEAEMDMRWPVRFAMADESVVDMEYDDETKPDFTTGFISFKEGGWYVFEKDREEKIREWKEGRSPAVYLYPVYTLGMSFNL